MDAQKIKSEIIDVINSTKNEKLIKELSRIIKLNKQAHKPKSRKFGSGKNLIEYIADDFNAPLEMFSNYQK